jgi:hypothetical protein
MEPPVYPQLGFPMMNVLSRFRYGLCVLAYCLLTVVAGHAQAPQNPTAQPGDGLVFLSWTPPSVDTDEAIACYRVYRDQKAIPDDTPSDLRDLVVATFETPTDSPSFDDADVTNGLTYFYRVTAGVVEQDEGDVSTPCASPNVEESNFSNQVSATPTGPVTVTITEPSVPVTDPVAAGTAVEVRAEVENAAPGSVEFRYRQGGRDRFAALPMQQRGDAFVASIPADSVTVRGAEFFVTAQDNRGGVARAPAEDEASVRVRSDRLSFSQAGGTAQSAYRMVSFPTALDDDRLAALFEDSLGPPDNTRWRLFGIGNGRLAGPDDYEERTDMSTSLAPGRALWLITRADAALDSGPATSIRTDQPFRIPLEEGWNLIANPFAFDVPRSNLRAEDTSGSLQDVFGYDGTFVPRTGTDVLAPYRGYLVRLSDGSSGTLVIEPHLDVGLTSRSASSRLQTDWILNVEARVQQARDAHNTFGVASDASDGLDRQDGREPPPIGRYVSLAFAPAAAPTASLWRDVRPDARTVQFWDAQVRTNVAGVVQLTVTGLSQVPDSYGVWLVDPVQKAAQDLRRSATYHFSAAGDAKPKPLRFVVGPSKAVSDALADRPSSASEVALLPSAPHPIRTHATLRYRLPDAGPVTLELYDLLGRRVSTLVDRQHQSAGLHTLSWAAEADGRALSSGTYVLRLHAGGVSRTRRLVVVR